MKFARVGVALAAAVIVVGACGGGGGGSKTLKIGITLPLSGSSLASAGPARDGALLAIKEANAAGTVKGYTLESTVLDHAVNGQYDAQQGAKDMTTLVSDTGVVAAIGPFNSAVAKVQIPVSNEAGLLQCSPANTNPDLTKGDAGKQLRAKNPDKIAYVRVATTDDIQGPAVAQYAYNVLGLKNVAIIDDLTVYGKGIADAFSAEFEKLGGKVVGREGADPKTTDFLPILTKFKGLSPDSVFYGGVTAANSASSVAAIHDIPDAKAFADKYQAEFKTAPGAYSASGYACAQIIIKAMADAAAKGDVTREAIRAGVTAPGTTFDTVLGPVKFDEVGDTSQKIISLYKTDLTAGDGKGDWVFDKQIDYAAAP